MPSSAAATVGPSAAGTSAAGWSLRLVGSSGPTSSAMDTLTSAVEGAVDGVPG